MAAITAVERAPGRAVELAKAGANRVSGGFAGLGLFLVQFVVLALWHAVVDIIVRRKYLGVVGQQISDVVAGAGAFVIGGGMVAVIFVTSFFSGAQVGLQGYTGLEQIGAEQFTGLVGSLANVREVTPIIAGTAIAAQIGTSFTAEIGAMRVSDEIDALEVMGIRSFVYLVATRLVATVTALVPLYLIALLTSFFATRLISVEVFGMSPGVYDYYFDLYLPVRDILFSTMKVAVFAVVVVLVHCYHGYYAFGGPEGVGKAVGRAVRASISLLVVINLLLSFLIWGSGSTVSLTG